MGTPALAELREKLRSAPGRFTDDRLQLAFDLRYHKALVDIISMVKHAANEEAPLLTAEERVDLAIAKVTEGQFLTSAQSKWLERIRVHLTENLSIDRTDFDQMPVFSRYGGWGAADRTFEGRLGDLLVELNEAIAA